MEKVTLSKYVLTGRDRNIPIRFITTRTVNEWLGSTAHSDKIFFIEFFIRVHPPIKIIKFIQIALFITDLIYDRF